MWVLFRDTSFLVADPEFSAFISLWPDLKLRQYWRKVQKASWLSFFLMIREKKCLSSSFLSGFCEVRRKVQPQVCAGFIFFIFIFFSAQDLNMVILSSSGHLWKSQVSSCSHTCASPCFALFTERSQLASWLLLIFLWHGLLESSRRKCKWPTLAYVEDFFLKLRRRHIFPVIFLWLLQK